MNLFAFVYKKKIIFRQNKCWFFLNVGRKEKVERYEQISIYWHMQFAYLKLCKMVKMLLYRTWKKKLIRFRSKIFDESPFCRADYKKIFWGKIVQIAEYWKSLPKHNQPPAVNPRSKAINSFWKIMKTNLYPYDLLSLGKAQINWTSFCADFKHKLMVPCLVDTL